MLWKLKGSRHLACGGAPTTQNQECCRLLRSLPLYSATTVSALLLGTPSLYSFGAR
jgi:hypothetical protein